MTYMVIEIYSSGVPFVCKWTAELYLSQEVIKTGDAKAYVGNSKVTLKS